MNEELQELAEDVHEKENKNHEKQENILQKIANVKIEDKRVHNLKILAFKFLSKRLKL